MKTRLLKELRRKNVIYERNGEYKYICRIVCDGGAWFIETDWTRHKKDLLERRRIQILKEARQYKIPKKILER